MGLPYRPEIEHIAELAGLTYAWCEEALRLLAVDDISGVIAAELRRLAHTEGFDEGATRSRLQLEAHHRYATLEVRPLVLESVALACWEQVVEHARAEEWLCLKRPAEDPEFKRFRRRLSNPARLRRLVEQGRVVEQNLDEEQLQRLWTQRQIGRRLGVDGDNINRWEDSITLPQGENVLGAVLIALEGTFDDVPLNDRESVLTLAACRTLAFIREGRYGRRTSRRAERLPTVEEVAAVRSVLRHDFADAFLPNDGPGNVQQQDGLLEEVCLDLGGRPAPTVRRAVDEWAMAYAHLRIALVSGWHDGTEDEWNWGDVDVTDPRV